ncbi:MAG TPA: histidine kinase [Verrucomicrobiae bacterium]
MTGFLSLVRQVISGLRLRLLLMMLLACAPLVALMLHGAWDDRRRAQDAWRSEVRNISQIARKEEKEIVDTTRQLLLAVSELQAVKSLDAENAGQSLAGIHQTSARYANLGLLTISGDVVASVAPSLESNLSGHNFFKRVLERRTFIVGSVTFSSRSGNPHLYFGFPVRSNSEHIIGVVYAELDLNAYCRDSEIPRHLPKDTTWTEVDEKGKVIAFYNPPPQIGQDKQKPSRAFVSEKVGRKIADPWLLTNAWAHVTGVIESPDRLSDPKIYAFVPIRNRFAPGDVVGILATPRKSLFADTDRALARNLTGVGIAVGVALMLGWIGSSLLVLRPVKALVRSSAQLAYGDLSVRTGLKPSHDELGQLTHAFDQMAQALEAREQEHQRASQKLQVLSHRLVEVQEAERRHIARELHDEIGQSLTAAEMNLQAALQSPRAASQQKRLEESIQAVERVLEQVHDLSLNLRPSMLDDLGLEPALRWYTHRQAALIGMRAEFKAEPIDERLDPLIETACFRVAQEALTNVVRHARAHLVKVELRRNNGHLHLSVCDDGVGFDVNSLHDEAVRGASLGLLSMEERTSLAGGGIDFTSVAGAGTEVHAWFPLVTRDLQSRSQSNE